MDVGSIESIPDRGRRGERELIPSVFLSLFSFLRQKLGFFPQKPPFPRQKVHKEEKNKEKENIVYYIILY